MSKFCSKCGIEKTDENTHRRSEKSNNYMAGKLNPRCRKCDCEATKRWATENPEQRRRYDKTRRQTFFSRLASLKSERPCYDCGGMFPPEAMDWDHLTDKKFEVSKGLGIPWDEVRREIDKCQLVCSNCHRIRTANRKREGAL